MPRCIARRAPARTASWCTARRRTTRTALCRTDPRALARADLVPAGEDVLDRGFDRVDSAAVEVGRLAGIGVRRAFPGFLGALEHHRCGERARTHARADRHPADL